MGQIEYDGDALSGECYPGAVALYASKTDGDMALLFSPQGARAIALRLLTLAIEAEREAAQVDEWKRSQHAKL